MGCRFLFTISPLEETRLLKDGKTYGGFGRDLQSHRANGLEINAVVDLVGYSSQRNYQAVVVAITESDICFKVVTPAESGTEAPSLGTQRT